jgi:hypothetical protein
MEPKNEQNNQASNDAAKSQQPRKTWVEPELAILGVEGGVLSDENESFRFGPFSGSMS